MGGRRGAGGAAPPATLPHCTLAAPDNHTCGYTVPLLLLTTNFATDAAGRTQLVAALASMIEAGHVESSTDGRRQPPARRLPPLRQLPISALTAARHFLTFFRLTFRFISLLSAWAKAWARGWACAPWCVPATGTRSPAGHIAFLYGFSIFVKGFESMTERFSHGKSTGPEPVPGPVPRGQAPRSKWGSWRNDHGTGPGMDQIVRRSCVPTWLPSARLAPPQERMAPSGVVLSVGVHRWHPVRRTIWSLVPGGTSLFLAPFPGTSPVPRNGPVPRNEHGNEHGGRH